MCINPDNVNAIKIQEWRDRNPDKQITTSVLREVLDVNTLMGIDLTDADLSGADLSDVSLYESTLIGVNLTNTDLARTELIYANLTHANMSGTDLYRADLSYANLTYADLSYANLTHADLSYANLTDTDLYGANLRGTNLYGANLLRTEGGVAQISSVCPYPVYLQPTPDGWYTRVGCWYATLDTLHAIATSDDDEDWLEVTGIERARGRPLLQAILGVFDAQMANHPGLIKFLHDRWKR